MPNHIVTSRDENRAKCTFEIKDKKLTETIDVNLGSALCYVRGGIDAYRITFPEMTHARKDEMPNGIS